MTEKDFPPLPDLSLLKTINKYQNEFSHLFDPLERGSSDLNTGIAIFFELYKIANDENTPIQVKTELVEYLESNSFKSIVFNDHAKILFYLSRMKLKRNHFLRSSFFTQYQI